jgi:hypothetical protein
MRRLEVKHLETRFSCIEQLTLTEDSCRANRLQSSSGPPANFVVARNAELCDELSTRHCRTR